MNRQYRYLPAAALSLAFVAACGDTTTEPRSVDAGAPALVAAAGSQIVYWQGHGSEHIQGCTGGYHWIVAPGGGLTGAPRFFSSIPADNDVNMFRMSANAGANAAWHYNSGLVSTVAGSTPYVVLQGTPHPQVKLIISHCIQAERENLTVSKTVDTRFERTHAWDIAKRVETENEHVKDGLPKIWLYANGSGDETATWTVDVSYKGYTDGAHNVSGEIFIANTGNLPAVIQSVTDVLGGSSITVACPVTFPHTLAVGAELTCSYDENGYFTGNNVATVTTGRDTYSTTEPIIWGAPAAEHYKTVNVQDTSDLFGTVALGTVTAPTGNSFTYDKPFAYAAYGNAQCGAHRYDNTARIVETGQQDDASLKVNVQCIRFESAWARGTGANVTAKSFCAHGFNNWGWTNAVAAYGSYEWPLYAGAGQCDVSKGTLVGHFRITHYAPGVFTREFVPAPGVTFEGAAVYADTGMFPRLRNGSNTTAPGQYYVRNPIPGPTIHVIAHVNAGIPDPNFGP